MLAGPAGQPGIAGSISADLGGGQVRAEPVHHRGSMGVGVGINPDDGVNEVCEHGHGPFSLRARAVRTGTGLEAHTQRHICDESRTRSSGRGQASDQASKVSQAGAGDPRRHVKGKARPTRGGQII